MAHNYNAYPFGRWIKWAVIGLIILIIIISSISTYNSLISAEQNVKRTWSQVENQMQRRADTITNIVESVKGYIKHEEKVFGDIAAARSVIISGSEDIQSKLTADEEIKVAGRQILALVESYPELKASEQFSDLNVVIEGSENRVAVARKDFIYAVQEYNNKVKRFPGKIFAGMMGFEPMDYFEADETAKEAPKVQF
jgi:LemA protein